MYDAEVGGFTRVDPLADSYSAWSPYNYVMGNPISNIDPDGRSVENTIFKDEDGNEIHRTEDNLENAVVIIDNDQLQAFKEKLSISGGTDNDIAALREYGLNYYTDDLDYLYDKGLQEPLSNYRTVSESGKVGPAYSEYTTKGYIDCNNVCLGSWSERTGSPYSNTAGAIEGTVLVHTHPAGENFEVKDQFGWRSAAQGHSEANDSPSNADFGQIAPYHRDYKTYNYHVAVKQGGYWFYRVNSSGDRQQFFVGNKFFK
jgi:hypothetical protein